jgi:hypothetical protein
MKSIQFLVPALTGIALICGNAFADTPLFAAKELQLKNAIPNEAELIRPFEDTLPALLTTSKDNQLVKLGNCQDYLAVRKQIIGSDNESDYSVLIFQTVPCTALALLKSASIAKQSALPDSFLSYTNTAFYPATLWPAVSKDERESRKWLEGSLSVYTKKTALRKINKKTLELEKSGYGLHITLLARGDFNHDGWEDAAFRWEGYAVQGSYTDARLVVLTRTSTKDSFRELSLELLLSTL